ncbi:hypothetical protein L484_011826 [Morus notabilis]|uniref:Uncharacterized protein n=1 Tax=Morus notabilis TaxID=981085 RepID=W9SEF4_9ROSA|nr:hypothetical protein L484_011826 [Morus notabilis]
MLRQPPIWVVPTFRGKGSWPGDIAGKGSFEGLWKLEVGESGKRKDVVLVGESSWRSFQWRCRLLLILLKSNGDGVGEIFLSGWSEKGRECKKDKKRVNTSLAQASNDDAAGKRTMREGRRLQKLSREAVGKRPLNDSE